ncbi:MAG: hypothetical protein ABI901_04490, partial [Roseiflexaceae bacterium]
AYHILYLPSFSAYTIGFACVIAPESVRERHRAIPCAPSPDHKQKAICRKERFRKILTFEYV